MHRQRTEIADAGACALRVAISNCELPACAFARPCPSGRRTTPRLEAYDGSVQSRMMTMVRLRTGGLGSTANMVKGAGADALIAGTPGVIPDRVQSFAREGPGA